MAIFEKISQNKDLIDDTETLTCTIVSTQNINKHTEYILRVFHGPQKEIRSNVSRRYRDFAALHASLQPANIDLPLPPKKLIGNMQPSFIAERQIALQNYINEVLEHEILALSLQVRCFLDPTNYSLDISEQALQTVSIALRGDGRYELKGPLPNIGWRIRKHYFLVTDIESKTNYMLSWQNYGADRYLNDKDLQTTLKGYLNINHQFIDKVLAINNLETGAYVVRKIHENGSLRDILYGTEYNKNYLAKYGNSKGTKPFTTGQIIYYGYQILHALKFLNERNIPHGHIHLGNIAIDNQRAVLMDIENFVMGVPTLYRPHLLHLKTGTKAEAVDAYCFGRIVFEMALGWPMPSYFFYESWLDGMLDPLVESFLKLCLSRNACKHGRLTISQLLEHPLFNDSLQLSLTRGNFNEGTHLKYPSALKKELSAGVANMESRLKSDQQMARNARREVRIQEILSSEEEMKKQKRKAKKRGSNWKSTSSLADTVRSQSVSTASSPTPPDLCKSNGNYTVYTDSDNSLM